MTPVDAPPPDITVSIVSYNTCALLRACLASLQACRESGEAALEIVVADNGSTDGSVEMARAEFPEVCVIETGGNIGYGRANNRAQEGRRGRCALILNSDTEIEPGALKKLRDFLDKHPDAGAAGAQLILPDGAIQASCARDPGLMAVLWEQTYLYKLLPNNKITGGYTMTYWKYDEEREVEQIAGACLFIRRTAWNEIGGFDPAYFMYFEDTDLCIRLRRAGWKIFFVPTARIRHHVGASSGKDDKLRARMIAGYNQSRFYYFTRYEGRARGRLLKALVLAGAGLRVAAWSVLGLTRPAARAQARLFRDVWRQTRAMTPHGEEAARP